jgi:hypothetical protein
VFGQDIDYAVLVMVYGPDVTMHALGGEVPGVAPEGIKAHHPERS